MTDWEPATEAEFAMRDALRGGDQELYFRILSRSELLLPISADAIAGRAPVGWGTWTTGARTHVLAFTSIDAMRVCLAEHAGSARRVPYAELAAHWPNVEWWLAVDPGLPIEGYLPAWFVSQLARGDVRLPGRTLGARARIERAESLQRARAVASVPTRSLPTQVAPPSTVDRLGREERLTPHASDPSIVDGTIVEPARPSRAGSLASRTSLASSLVPRRRPTDPLPNDDEPDVGRGFGGTGDAGLAQSGFGHAAPTRPTWERERPSFERFGGESNGGGGRPAEPPSGLRRRDAYRGLVPDPAVEPPAPPPVTPPPGPPAAPPPAPPAASTGSPIAPAATLFTGARRRARAAGGLSPSPEPPDQPSALDLGRSGGAHAAEEGPPPPRFDPANDVEVSLLGAVEDGNTDAFLSTLLLARVLLPIPVGGSAEEKPGDPTFVWRTETIEETPYVVVFTSPERLVEHLGEPRTTVDVKFAQLIRAWPDEQWSFAINPGTPVGAKLPGTQIVALANWAAEVGLGDEPPVEEPKPAPPTPAPVSVTGTPVAPAGGLTVMQKPVPPHQVDFYTDRGYDRVSGFVYRASELAHLRTPAQLYAALGLGFPGSRFEPEAEQMYVLRWAAHRPSLYRIPYGGPHEAAMQAMQGWVIERPPFRGNGFAPSETGDIIAEFKLDSMRLPHGAQLWRLTSDGSESLIALLDADGPKWRRVDAS